MPPSPTEPSAGQIRARATVAAELVDEAREHLAAGRLEQAVRAARQAAEPGRDPPRALPVLALALAAQGDVIAAVEAAQQALDAAPRSAEVAGEMGRLALSLGRCELAELALTVELQAQPSSAVAVDLALAQSGLRAFDRAQATLTAALEADPAQPRLWTALAQLLCVQGRHAQAIVFFDESLRLDPASAAALDGIAEALLLSGDLDRALAAGEEAVAVAGPQEAPRRLGAHALRLLAAGRSKVGWDAFARAFPGDNDEIEIRIAAPRWTLGRPAEGQVVLFGETDLALEIVLSQTVPDLVARGPPPILALDRRWTALAARSFPGAQVVERLERLEGGRRLQAADLDSPNIHAGGRVGPWAPLRAVIPDLRGDPEAFTDGSPFLTPDPARVDHWRERLAALGPEPKVGVLWRPPSGDPERTWEAPPLPVLATALTRPGLVLIGIQEEEIQAELDWIRQMFGLPLLDPPPEYRAGDLDDLAALAVALDVVVGAPGPASFVAAGCGAQTWLLSPPRHWAQLGSKAFPWFGRARVFQADAPDDWLGAMAGLDAALSELAGRP